MVELFRLVDWMMTLPRELEQEFQSELRQYQEERQMPYITSVERLTQVETLQEGILEALRLRFGILPQDLTNALKQIDDIPQLKQLHRSSITSGSLEEFQNLLLQDTEPD